MQPRRAALLLSVVAVVAFDSRDELDEEEIEYRRKASKKALDEMRDVWCVGERSASDFCVEWAARDSPPTTNELWDAHEHFCSDEANQDAPPCRRMARKKTRKYLEMRKRQRHERASQL